MATAWLSSVFDRPVSKNWDAKIPSSQRGRAHVRVNALSSFPWLSFRALFSQPWLRYRRPVNGPVLNDFYRFFLPIQTERRSRLPPAVFRRICLYRITGREYYPRFSSITTLFRSEFERAIVSIRWPDRLMRNLVATYFTPIAACSSPNLTRLTHQRFSDVVWHLAILFKFHRK